jgi:hypothetical protein
VRVECVYPGPVPGPKIQPVEDDISSRLKHIEASLRRLESRLSPVDSAPSTFEQQHDSTPTETEHIADEGDGKLFLKASDARYVAGSFWADLDEEESDEAVEPDASTDIPSNLTQEPTDHQPGMIYGFSSVSPDLRQLHPPESQIFPLWQIFLENVDPLLKIIHVPVTQRQLVRATQNLDSVPAPFQAFMFAIYYATITSMQCSISCKTLLNEDRNTLLNRYQLGVEQALSKANFISKPNILALQALTLYLICARLNTDKTYVWTMTGLVIRIATKLGLHRDPVSLGVAPFIAEIRRRLWWQICILDVRTAEENDMDPMLCEHNFDTKLPSNLNDSELDISMTQLPPETPNRTEMLYPLTRLKISYEARKLVFSPKFTAENGYQSLSFDEKKRLLQTLQKEIEDQWLRNCDMKVPICFLTATSARMVLSKINLTIHHPARSGSSGVSHELRVDLVDTALEIVEYAHTLRNSSEYAKWAWLFQKYIEWDAIAFVQLSSCQEKCIGTLN